MQLGLIDDGVKNVLKDSERFGGVIAIAHKHIGNDKLAVRFHIRKNDDTGVFTVDSYNAILIKIPPFRHGVFNGIDTAKLEEKLQQYEWNLGTIPLPRDGKEVSEAFFELIDLARSEDQNAADIAEKLMMKYWSETPMERFVTLCQDPSFYERRMDFPIHNNLNDVDDRQAYNLLSGRALMKFEDVKAGNPTVSWVTVAHGEFVEHPDFDLSGQLRKLAFQTPLDSSTGPEYVLELAKGNRIPAELQKGNANISVLLEADPRTSSIAIFDHMDNRLDLADFQIKNELNKKAGKAAKPGRKITPTPRKRGKGL